MLRIDKLSDIDLNAYEAFIVDVDGTLFDLRKMQYYMMWRLLCYYSLHFWQLKDLLIIYLFRRERERLAHQNIKNVAYEQYRIVAIKISVETERVRRLIEYWMQEVPLSYLVRCENKLLIDFLKSPFLAKKKILVLSDYPANKKIEILGIRADGIFCSTDSEIDSLKPNPRGLEVILDKFNLKIETCLLIGDRENKEGVMATKIGMSYIII